MPGAKTCAYVFETGSPCKAYVKADATFCGKHQPKEETMSETTQPEESPGARAHRMAMEAVKAEAAEAAPVPRVVPRPANPKGLPAQQAHEIARQMAVKQREEELERQRLRKERRGRNIPPPTPLHVLLDFHEERDLSAMVDEAGRSLVKPGYVGRWVRTKDADGKPTSIPVDKFRAWGAEDVIKDGKPWVDSLGKAMQIPEQRAAARMIKNASDGVFDLDVITNKVQASFDETNRQYGREVSTLVVGEEHGLESRG
jgi:hypothetical protein